MNTQRKKIIVLGGYGAVGSRICTAIARIPYVECVIAGRNPKRAQYLAKLISASILKIDLADERSIQRELADAFLVINAAGPFQNQPLVAPEFCASAGIHYIDINDDRHYHNEVLRQNAIAKRNGCLLVTGAASLPALASLLVDSLSQYFDKIDEIHVCAAVGNKVPVGRAGAYSLLLKIGTRARMKLGGRWGELPCWTKPVRLRFPGSLGKISTYIYDIPAIDHFSRHYGTREATFRMGLQLAFVNYGLALLGWLRRKGLLKQPARYARPLFLLSKWLKRFGGPDYALQVKVLGTNGAQSVEHSATLFEPDSDGLGVTTSIVVALVSQWLENGVPDSGAVSAIGVVDLESVKSQLIEHNVKLIRA
jgi:saccharopine dehydrogenase-like NADP-dependent oxidoreductase